MAAAALTLAVPGTGWSDRAQDPVVAAMGDSLTAGYGLEHPETDSYPVVARVEGAGLDGACVVDDGGCFVSPITEWFKDAVRDMDEKPDTVVVLIGINDIIVGQTYSEIVDGYRHLERMGRRLDVRVVYGTLLPTTRAYRSLARLRARVNEWIRTQDTYVDYADALRRGTWLDERYDVGDGVHPNARGHRRLAKWLTEWIEEDGSQ